MTMFFISWPKCSIRFRTGFPRPKAAWRSNCSRLFLTQEQADLFCDLRLTFETAAEIADRTGRPLDGLEERLIDMVKAGQLFMIKLGGTRYYKMLPWVFGIYEFQLGRMDKEFAELVEEYWPAYGKQFFTNQPQLMQTLAVEETIPSNQEALPYEKVSTHHRQWPVFSRQ